jgi:hypothetical protein
MSNTPISVDLPHRLGAAEAKRRIAANIGGLAAHLPAGARVRSGWEGDRMKLAIALMGQDLDASLDVQEKVVRVTMLLPPVLAFFGKAIEAALKRGGTELLEDRSGRS